MSVEQNCRELLQIANDSGLVWLSRESVSDFPRDRLAAMANKLAAIIEVATPLPPPMFVEKNDQHCLFDGSPFPKPNVAYRRAPDGHFVETPKPRYASFSSFAGSREFPSITAEQQAEAQMLYGGDGEVFFELSPDGKTVVRIVSAAEVKSMQAWIVTTDEPVIVKGGGRSANDT